ncbi:S8 family serine peptidase [Paraneptunicella aestuarii]|uniref:S8 family serine peptidase n=1 Tax=Paraneptunicella aestuarii TaxID=2831148 RepID=UPI001E3982CF|nr:S8 family serine peptidase [Paraneptunicella aestuarii]UAA38648.1 S8 family serine peptidase [Paraneptunicella aestuarii]
MKKAFTSTLMAAAVATAFSANAANDRYIIQVDNAGKGIVKALAKQSGGEIQLDSNGFIAATFAGKSLDQVKGLMNNPHVKLVEEDFVRRPMAVYSDDAGDPMVQQVTPYGYYQAEANLVNFNANAGMKVCVIDSGLDQTNPDFVWSRITGDNDSGTGNWFENGGPHGTHVAGTIGAADNSYGVIGMAPGVNMHIIKVFNAAGWGYSSDLAHAANLCSAAGANLINMSLGGGGANATEENAFNAFRDAGGLVLAAAGNDGNDVASYPAAYSSVMMIGAADANNNIADFSQFPTCVTGKGPNARTDDTICVEVAAGGVDTLSTYPAGMATSSSFSADGVSFASSAMENFGSATGATYFMGTAEAVDSAANGKICVIDRGNISFHDKVANCEASGGIGAVVINNVAGMLYGTLGDPNTTTIPAIGAALEDRAAILAASTATVDVVTSDYGTMSGTSMATPTVTGIAALVWSNHPTCTGEEIRAALKATAEDQGAAGHDVNFGYGLVKAGAANNYLTTNGCAGGNNGGGDFTMTASGYKVRGYHTVDLSWAGATTSNVDIYRDGQLVVTTANDGAYTDSMNSKARGVTYTYQICEESTSTCTTTATVSF